ncbi:MAG TPA: tetratricopeptide repeat protein [Rhizomicrobium sp.]|nr:tetratricopeptide repeat protein [Rhizomicrobium sp.]
MDGYDRAIAIKPAFADALLNRGDAMFSLERYDEAASAYGSAIAVRPGNARAHYSQGNALYELGHLDEAVTAYGRAIEQKPDFATAFANRGNALSRLKRFQEAFASYDVAFKLNPQLPYVEGSRLYAKAHLCDWNDFDAEHARLSARVRAGTPVAWPFAFLTFSDSPADQLKCAEICVDDRYPAISKPFWNGERYKHDKIRLAYISADFGDMPMPALMTEIFEEHDRAGFEVSAISLGPDCQTETRIRLERAFDTFVDARASTDQQVAALIREMEIDIAIDLMGFTTGARTGIFAHRPAPVQVSYLGFPGTMGATYVDYILADRVVIPRELQSAYSEKIAYLPGSYIPNDSKREVAAKTPSRRELQLPDDAFVYCCFNSPHKLTPEMFQTWMRILRQVDGSVLWLLKGCATSVENLRREALQSGIAPERLIFAPRIAAEDHLARHRQADLFLDTRPYNAHTGAIDALWMGLPVLTCTGSTFASRVSASALVTIGLSELVVNSLDAYERSAIQLASEPARLATLKAKLARDGKSTPLFDAQRAARDLEAAYRVMWRRYQNGEKPKGFEGPR